MITIPLSRGEVALIDDCDADLVLPYRWHADRSGATWYARHTFCFPGGGRLNQSMHKLITGYARTDHRNGDGLDNRRCNLRSATRSQNLYNQRKARGTSQFKGVSRRYTGTWVACIKVDGRQRHIGTFADEVSAAHAYDAAARVHFGEFAALNFPRSGERSAHLMGYRSVAA